MEVKKSKINNKGIFALKNIEKNQSICFLEGKEKTIPEINKVIKKIQEKLCVGGIAIIDFPNRFSPWHSIIKPIMGIDPHIHDKLYSSKDISELYKNTGMNIEKIKRFLFTSRRLPTFLLPLFVSFDIVFERIPPFPLLAGIIMVKGQKT